MEKPEFRKLLNEYFEAMQDPETKKEEEEYLKQLEREAEEGNYQLQILIPESAFCVKCRNKAREKVYINICTSDKVEIFREDYTGQSRNATWNIPLSIGKPRSEVDKHGKAIETYDAVFHPKTVQLANDSQKFMCFLVEICVEHINEGYQKSLVPEFRRLAKVVSKGKPSAQSIRVKSDDPAASPVSMPGLDAAANVSTINMLPSCAPKPKAEAPAHGAFHPPIPSEPVPVPKPKAKPKATVQCAAPPPQWVQPDYALVHRGEVSLGDAWNEREDLKRRLPKELVLTVQLPLMVSSNEADSLEITESRVFLKSDKRMYYLDLQLPFPVDEDKCSAKFDKNKRVLTVAMGVRPPSRPDVQRLLEEKEKEKAEFSEEARKLAAEEERERAEQQQKEEERLRQEREEKERRERARQEEEERQQQAREELERRLEEQRQRQQAEERALKLKVLQEKARQAREAQEQAAKQAALAEQESREKELLRQLQEQREAEEAERLLRVKEEAIALRNRFIFEID
eukprot:GGOE01061951.1.p1 GENE.GGOE01061951.1~~GGOE01061951.1.p1  ORF type:complete len:555 (+),score=184.50 GGOE01061951.1:126-1667(+)